MPALLELNIKAKGATPRYKPGEVIKMSNAEFHALLFSTYKAYYSEDKTKPKQDKFAWYDDEWLVG